MPQQFTDVAPIQKAQTFTNITPIGGGPDPANPAASIPNPAAPDNPNNPIARNPTYHDYETIGSSEGAGLAEGLSDWDEASFGEMGGGVTDVARGNVARGMHRTISGTMNAAVPASPFVAAAAPAAMARGVIAGTMGGKVARTGAEVLGATPDQADLAGDIGNLAGGGVGAKAGGGRVGAVTKVGAQDAFSRIPIIGRLVRRPSAMDYVTAAMKGQPAPTPPGPEVRFPEAPAPEVLQASALQAGGRPVADPSAGLGRIPVSRSIAESMPAPTNAEPSPIATTPAAQQSAAPAPKATPRPMSKGQLGKAMDEQLGKALGAQQLDPKVPLRNQVPGRMPAESEAALPEGHTAVDSSAVRSYGYKPAAREFEARATSGNTIYVYGDVPPEVATEFVDAPSKGKAWQKIRSYPLVAKIVDGKRIAVKPEGTR